MGRNHRWLMVLVLYLSGVIVVINQFKVPPVMADLMNVFHVTPAESGWFMSVFALTGLLLALPSAVLLEKFGPKRSGSAGLVCVVIGSLLGWLAASGSVLLLGRTIEGVGLSMIAVIAPAVIAMYFRREEIGLPMGIWATWFPVGSAVSYNMSMPVVTAFGSWRGSWLAGAGLALVILVAFLFVVDRPQASPGVPAGPQERISLGQALRNKNIWFLGCSFLFLMLGAIGFLTWAPTYFVAEYGLPRGVANMYASLGFLWNIPSGIIGGWLLNKTRKWNALLVGCAVLSLATYTFGFVVPQSLLMPFLAVTGLVTGFVFTITLSMVIPVMKNPAYAGIGMGVIAIMQSGANLISTPLYGAFIAGGNWHGAVLPSALILAAGLVFTLLLAKNRPE